ncbi:MAG: hypothetical protein JXA13_08525 [Anaerolineales bacterium]|nr:hypothetical protein [Anaerolineales bacterium]
MKFNVKIKGFENQTVEVLTDRFFTRTKLFINGEEAPKGAKRGEILLRRKNGKEISARWIWQFPDIPKLMVGEETIDIVAPMKWYEWGWCVLPVMLIWAGYGWRGYILGTILAVIGIVLNLQIFRRNSKFLSRYGLTMAVTLALSTIYSLVAAVFFVTA